MQIQRLRYNNKGFTLIEMLVVLIILGLLAAIVVPRTMKGRRRATDEATRQTLSQLRKAVNEFEADVGCYPTALADLFTRPSGTYTGKGMAGGSVVDISIADVGLLWRGPYFNVTIVPVVPHGQGDWLLVTEVPPGILGNVKLSGATGRAMDGSYYADW